MEKRLVLRGALVGALAGLLAFLFARIFAEPKIQAAVGYESARDAAQDALDKAAGTATPPEGPELFSRTIQANLGIGVGMVAFGLAMGVLFAIAYTVCLGRVGSLRPRSIALAIAGAGFLAIYLGPFVKYPANPPSIGHEDTIKQRGGLYLVLVAASVLLMVSAIWLGQRLRERLGTWNATLIAGAAFVVAIGIVMWLLPAFGQLGFNKSNYGNFDTETPQPLRNANGDIVFPGFPADLLWDFRFLWVGAQLILWSVLGLVFAPLAERSSRRQWSATSKPNPSDEVVMGVGRSGSALATATRGSFKVSVQDAVAAGASAGYPVEQATTRAPEEPVRDVEAAGACQWAPGQRGGSNRNRVEHTGDIGPYEHPCCSGERGHHVAPQHDRGYPFERVNEWPYQGFDDGLVQQRGRGAAVGGTVDGRVRVPDRYRPAVHRRPPQVGGCAGDDEPVQRHGGEWRRDQPRGEAEEVGGRASAEVDLCELESHALAQRRSDEADPLGNDRGIIEQIGERAPTRVDEQVTVGLHLEVIANRRSGCQTVPRGRPDHHASLPRRSVGWRVTDFARRLRRNPVQVRGGPATVTDAQQRATEARASAAVPPDVCRRGRDRSMGVDTYRVRGRSCA